MKKKFDVFLNFNGECKEALEFYQKVFGGEVRDVMTYGQIPAGDGYQVPEEDKDRILYSCLPVFGCNMMFCDNPSAMPMVRGNNISLTLGTEDRAEVERLFHALGEGGEVGMPLEKTFWSELYGMVTDKFGITWQLSLFSE